MTSTTVSGRPDLASLLPRELREAGVRRGHELSWSFTPLNGKKPVLKGWQERPREVLDEALQWAVAGNIGLRTGQNSGVVVIDVDEGGDLLGLDLPSTVTAHTGGGGMHLYFKRTVPVGNSAGKLGEHIDVRGDGGQVVYPGSVHSDTGRTYEWAPGLSPWDVALAELPEHVIEMLTGSPPSEKGAASARTLAADGTGRERYAQAALAGELDEVHQAPEGSRNDQLNRSAFALGTLIGGGYLERSDVEAALLDAALHTGLGRHEAEATIRSGIEKGIKEPRTIPDRPVETPAPKKRLKRAAAPAGYAPSDTGNALRFADRFGDQVRHCAAFGRWYVWDGRHWAEDQTAAVENMAKAIPEAMRAEANALADAGRLDDAKHLFAFALHSESAPRLAAMLHLARSDRRIAVAPEQLDAGAFDLNVANGILDPRTATLRPHDPDALLTKLIEVPFDPGTAAPRWTRFLDEIMDNDGDLIAFLQDLVGLCLTGDISEHVLPILWGPGANGKSTFLDTIIALLGPYAYDAPPALLTASGREEHPTELAALAGKRLVVCGETEEGRPLKVALVKKLTGDTTLTARYIRRNYFTFTRTFKALVVSNHRPVIREQSQAVWRRLRLVPFLTTIPEGQQDKHLLDELRRELPGILAWSVEGCRRWAKEGLSCPAAVTMATASYRAEEDRVGGFIEECINDLREVPGDWKVEKARVLAAYAQWAAQNGEDALTARALTERIRGHGYEDRVAKINGRAARCWLGMMLQTTEGGI